MYHVFRELWDFNWMYHVLESYGTLVGCIMSSCLFIYFNLNLCFHLGIENLNALQSFTAIVVKKQCILKKNVEEFCFIL